MHYERVDLLVGGTARHGLKRSVAHPVLLRHFEGSAQSGHGAILPKPTVHILLSRKGNSRRQNVNGASSMRLYHGTNINFGEIDLTKSLPNKDFGKGFYLSDTFSQAQQMAKAKVERLGGIETVIEYSFDESLLHNGELKTKIFNGYDIEWADFIIQNRSNTTTKSLHDYDIIVGPIANDRIGLQILRLAEGDIDKETFLRKIRYMKGTTIQYFFGTTRATATLKRI